MIVPIHKVRRRHRLQLGLLLVGGLLAGGLVVSGHSTAHAAKPGEKQPHRSPAPGSLDELLINGYHAAAERLIDEPHAGPYYGEAIARETSPHISETEWVEFAAEVRRMGIWVGDPSVYADAYGQSVATDIRRLSDKRYAGAAGGAFQLYWWSNEAGSKSLVPAFYFPKIGPPERFPFVHENIHKQAWLHTLMRVINAHPELQRNPTPANLLQINQLAEAEYGSLPMIHHELLVHTKLVASAQELGLRRGDLLMQHYDIHNRTRPILADIAQARKRRDGTVGSIINSIRRADDAARHQQLVNLVKTKFARELLTYDNHQFAHAIAGELKIDLSSHVVPLKLTETPVLAQQNMVQHWRPTPTAKEAPWLQLAKRSQSQMPKKVSAGALWRVVRSMLLP